MKLSRYKYEIILAILFVVSFYVRVNVNGIFPGNPGNVKASDPVYHTLVSEYIAKTGIVGKEPDYFAWGRADALDEVPPFQALVSGGLIALSGIESWDIYYAVVCLFSALSVVLMYLIAEKVFASKDIAIIAAGILVIPMSFSRWFYYLFIGIWPQNSVFTLMLFVVYVSLLYIQSQKRIYLVIAGLGNAGVFLLHWSELVFLLPIDIYMIYFILKQKKDIISRAADLVLLGGVSFALSVVSYSTLLMVRTESIPYFGFHTIDFNSLYYITTIRDIGIVYGVLALLALVQLFLNYRKYLWLLLYVGFYFFVSYLLPYFLQGEYYLLRPRLFALFPIALLAAYGAYYFLVRPARSIVKSELIPAIAIVLILMAIGFPGYQQTRQMVSGQNMPEARYQGFKWMLDNTDKAATVYYFGSSGQQEDNFMERIRYNVNLNKINEALQQSNNTIPLMYDGEWGGFVTWTSLARARGFFSVDYPSGNPARKDKPKSLLEFDYVYFENLSEGLMQFNTAVAQYLVQNYGFRPVYNNQVTIILKNEKKAVQ